MMMMMMMMMLMIRLCWSDGVDDCDYKTQYQVQYPIWSSCSMLHMLLLTCLHCPNCVCKISESKHNLPTKKHWFVLLGTGFPSACPTCSASRCSGVLKPVGANQGVLPSMSAPFDLFAWCLVRNERIHANHNIKFILTEPIFSGSH